MSARIPERNLIANDRIASPAAEQERDVRPFAVPEPECRIDHGSKGALTVRLREDGAEGCLQAAFSLEIVDERHQQPALRAEVRVQGLDRYAGPLGDLADAHIGSAGDEFACRREDAAPGFRGRDAARTLHIGSVHAAAS